METWLEARKIVAFINSQHEMWRWQPNNQTSSQLNNPTTEQWPTRPTLSTTCLFAWQAVLLCIVDNMQNVKFKIENKDVFLPYRA